MLTGLRTLVTTASSTSFTSAAREIMSQYASWEVWLETVVVFAVLASASAFLVLAWRLCEAVHQFMAASLQRTRIEQRIFEILGDYIERQRLNNEQLWSASSALSPC